MREMMKTEVREKFAQTPDPSIRVALPLILRARTYTVVPYMPFAYLCNSTYRSDSRAECLVLHTADGKCQVYIETRSPTIWASWYDVWEAVETTVAACVRRGKRGWAAVASE